MRKIKTLLYNFTRFIGKYYFTGNLGKVVEYDDKLVCYVNKRKCKKDRYDYSIKCNGIRNDQQHFASYYKLNKPIHYVIDGIDFNKKVYIVSSNNNCDFTIKNCNFSGDLNISVNGNCLFKNNKVKSNGRINIGAKKLEISDINFDNHLYLVADLDICIGADDGINIMNSNIGKEKERTNITLTSDKNITLENTNFNGKKIKIWSKSINSDNDSFVKAENEADIKIDDLNKLQIYSPIIKYNNKEYKNDKESFTLEKMTDPLKIKRYELIRVLTSIKNLGEINNLKRVNKFKEDLSEKPLRKILK